MPFCRLLPTVFPLICKLFLIVNLLLHSSKCCSLHFSANQVHKQSQDKQEGNGEGSEREEDSDQGEDNEEDGVDIEED